MTTIFRFILTLVVANIAAVGHCQKLLWEKSSPHVMDRAVILAAEEFTPSHIEQLSKRYFEELSPIYVLARVTIGTTAEDIVKTSAQVRLQTTYADELNIVRDEPFPQGPVARILIWDHVGVLSIRNRADLQNRSIRAGPSSIAIHEGENGFELLHFQLSANAAPATARDKYSLTIYLKSGDDVSVNACIALTKRLQALTGVGFLSIAVRPDTWFFPDTGYPAIYLFSSDIQLPSEIHLSLTPFVSCGYRWRKGVTCTGEGFVP